MNKDIKVDNIIWVNANAEWLYSLIQQYNQLGKNLNMDYLSLGSLRYNEKYFVGYLYDSNNPNLPIELVTYIQYKMTSTKLILNYIDVAKEYRKKGIAKYAIDKFVSKIVTDTSIKVAVTTLSFDGKQANLINRLENNLTGEIVETSKRNVR